ncbi:hypothetical protein ACIGFK_35860 [Streptomyces sp. NPDC085524]|uniref:hypothetical protein n=1 Tax=unclassified Streptomyces TaxID=2593676 RepID=UPI0035DA055E
MTSARGSHPHRRVQHATGAPAIPWEGFDDLMDRMIGLFEAGRSAGHGDHAEADEEPRRRRP